MNLTMQLKYLFLLCFLIKIYHFLPNDPYMNVICFSNNDFFLENNEYKNIESLCLQKGGYLKKGQMYPYTDNEGNKILKDNTYCCNINCAINGTIVGTMCKWIEDKSFCKLTSNLYYVYPISIRGSRYWDISSDLLNDIYNLFNFNLFNGKYCAFKSREDLLINFAHQIDHKFIYSWGGGHKHFDQRLMDTSEGKGLLEYPFLIYPTYGVKGEKYDDSNVLGYDCSGLSMALIHLMGGYNFNPEFTNAQKMYDFAKEKKCLKNEIKIGYALFYGTSESDISHVTIALGENQMIEAPGHDENKIGKPIAIVPINRNKLIGIADFIYSPFENSENSTNKGENVILNSFILFILFIILTF